jgi:four helix bundle protein
MNMVKRKYDLEGRFIEFSVSVINLSEEIPDTRPGRHICSQILRSGTSPAPNYGEAQSAESVADFVHKLKIALKELRETGIWVKVLKSSKIMKDRKTLEPMLKETDELIAILHKSIQTSLKGRDKDQRGR